MRIRHTTRSPCSSINDRAIHGGVVSDRLAGDRKPSTRQHESHPYKPITSNGLQQIGSRQTPESTRNHPRTFHEFAVIQGLTFAKRRLAMIPGASSDSGRRHIPTAGPQSSTQTTPTIFCLGSQALRESQGQNAPEERQLNPTPGRDGPCHAQSRSDSRIGRSRSPRAPS